MVSLKDVAWRKFSNKIKASVEVLADGCSAFRRIGVFPRATHQPRQIDKIAEVESHVWIPPAFHFQRSLTSGRIRQMPVATAHG
jgi:hypothetical protein